LQTHLEHEAESDPQLLAKELPEVPVQKSRLVTPSLATLEKAVAARIYFEGLYFAILRQPPSREQRRKALENELLQMRISDVAKQEIRERWFQNETNYLRDRRARVDPSSFVKLKTIGHG
jgi:protein-serine/threonine kinase